MFPIIALDLDGTLLRTDGTISERTLHVLDRCLQAGLRVIIATARAPRMVTTLLPPLLSGLPCVCYNGAEVYEAGQRIAASHMAPEIARTIVRSVHRLSPGSAVSVEIDDWNYCDRRISNPLPYDVVSLPEFIDRPVAKLLFDASCVKNPETLALSFPRECACRFTGGGALGEITSAGSSKANGIAALLAGWSMGLRDVIAFGDDTPDVEMLRECGMGVAMANAAPEARSAADRLAMSNDEDGVAVVLEEMLECAAQL